MSPAAVPWGPEIRVSPPGPKARAIIERDRATISPSYTRGVPFVMDRGEGIFAWDVDGNKYIDFTTGVAVNALGHAHPEVVRAIAHQASKFVHMAGTDFYYEVMEQLARKLCQLAPGDAPKKCFFTNSGAEAIEAAIKLARWATRRPKLLAFINSFHGRTFGALSLTASKAVQRRGFGPFLDAVHAPFGDLEYIEKTLFGKLAPPEDIAAIFVEPIQGEGGYIVAPDGFLAGLHALCQKHGILLVADEIQTGLGRTGKMWAIQHWDVVPDILCIAKPIGGGVPLGAMIARADLQKWERGAHANTFGGNPLACAAGLAVIEQIMGKGLLQNATQMGLLLAARLEQLKERFRFLTEPTGLGLMRGIRVIDDQGRPDPSNRDRLLQLSFERGLLLLGCGEHTIRFLPPLNVTSEQLQAALDLFETVLKAA